MGRVEAHALEERCGPWIIAGFEEEEHEEARGLALAKAALEEHHVRKRLGRGGPRGHCQRSAQEFPEQLGWRGGLIRGRGMGSRGASTGEDDACAAS